MPTTEAITLLAPSLSSTAAGGVAKSTSTFPTAKAAPPRAASTAPRAAQSKSDSVGLLARLVPAGRSTAETPGDSLVHDVRIGYTISIEYLTEKTS